MKNQRLPYTRRKAGYTAGLLLLLCTVFLAPATAQNSITVPPTEAGWEGAADFVEHNGRQAIYLDDGGQGATGSNLVFARDLTFDNGTIDYYLAFDEGARFSSLHFRFQDEENEEHIYLRGAFADDPNASGGLQYAAVVKGVNYWDLSFPYQTGASFEGGGEWNHVRLVVRDRQLLTYVNDMERPALYVPIMDGLPGAGRIAVDGKVWVADLTVTPDATPGLQAGAGYDPEYNDVRYLRDWEMTAPADFPQGREPTGDDLPDSTATWRPITAEHHGMVNLSRPHGAIPRGERRIIWLRTTLTAREATERTLKLGVSDEAYLYLNGAPLGVIKNPYFTPAMLPPQGRATPENAALRLPLSEGDNELLIGLTNYFFGWGLVARLDDGGGLRY